mmetsp:Transcript_22329/g.33503  ORF Transcript_22329/g.33503 Transcript_22329/m.33503 type:complete len:98 (-) Transcript_22329:1213-1506(-)
MCNTNASDYCCERILLVLLCVHSDDNSRSSYGRQSTLKMMRWHVIDWLLERARDGDDFDNAAAIYTFRSGSSLVFVPHVLPSLLSFRVILLRWISIE